MPDTTPDTLEIDPAATDPRAVYRLLIGSVVPRPIGWASTVSAGGVANLAPFSFFTVVCVAPPMVSLTIMRKPDGSEKHTLKNVRANGEFCFNVVTRPVWQQMVDSANGFPEDNSEFAETGLTPIPSVKVKPPRVKEVPIHFECKLHQVLEARPQAPGAGDRRGGPYPRRSGGHDRRLYRHAQARSGRAPQRLFLRDARRNPRAPIQRWRGAMTGKSVCPSANRCQLERQHSSSPGCTETKRAAPAGR